MKKYYFVLSLIFLFFTISYSQSQFSNEDYQDYLKQNQNLTFDDLCTKFPLEQTYYKGYENEPSFDSYLYFDSIRIKFGLTEDESNLLKENMFLVSERLCDPYARSFGYIYHDIYLKDLPVFISSDVVLHALHASYDQILSDLEVAIMKPNLGIVLDGLYDQMSTLISMYGADTAMTVYLEDVDLYVTIAKSLLDGSLQSAQFTDQIKVDEIWDAIESEKLVSLSLFTYPERSRSLDFSQFTIRGHYTEKGLGEYFKAMMWLGRIEFFLTPPPVNPWERPWEVHEIQRMNIDAVLLDELIEITSFRDLLDANDELIRFMVGECDNLTPNELHEILMGLEISTANQLLDDELYDEFQAAVKAANGAEQKILSNFLLMDPFSSEPCELPVSFRVFGQRFIIDSYVFSNVVFDRIVFEDKKIFRGLPDPLDMLFVLGNDNVVPLLKDELDKYKYASQLAALRYLVDSYDDEFWNETLYNVWLNAIRSLNPLADTTGLPLFMRTAAWQQEKMNTQLASWSELRHDNLLYAKQSYTGASGCSFPHSFIEPYPNLYKNIALFAEKSKSFFKNYPSQTRLIEYVTGYFERLQEVVKSIESISTKETKNISLSDEDKDFLKRMLFLDGGSGRPPFSGWLPELFYYLDDAASPDYIIADVHTQPTDEVGTPVGNVLHVGTGKLNMAVVIAPCASNNFKPTAFVGPVMSYYEQIECDFNRLTDEEWGRRVTEDKTPVRPDWVNIYLADKDGKRYPQGRELPSEVYTGIPSGKKSYIEHYYLTQNYPNPFNPETSIKYQIPEDTRVRITIYNVLGQEVVILVDKFQQADRYTVKWDAHHLPSGLYICNIRAGEYAKSIKMILVR